MFDSNQFFGGGAGDFYPVSIDQSLRFNDNDSAYLSRTPASAGNRKTWTISFWMKRSGLGGGGRVFDSGTNADNWTSITFNGNDTLQAELRVSDTTQFKVVTSAVLRDASAWYHIVVHFDIPQPTPSNRLKLYINGEEASYSSTTYGSPNTDTYVNSTNTHYLGAFNTVSQFFDGYLAEVHFCDGEAYTADAFGELKSGVWVAKAPSVDYGTNGFHLDFANSADIGNDISGNGNDWTPNNFTASDVVADSPTDNFATLNPLSQKNSPVLSEGNLKITGQGTGSYRINTGTIGVSSGKWYFEGTFNGSLSGENASVGITTQSFAGDINNSYVGQGSTEWGILLDSPNDILKSHSALSSYSDTWADGDIFKVAFDVDGQKIWFGKNETWYASGDPSSGTNAAFTNLTAESTFYPVVSMLNNDSFTLNFGQSGFTYTPPTGYLALSTANLPEPTFSPADDASPEDYFDIDGWEGTGTTHERSNFTFQPDWVWIKNRDNADNHYLYDSVRGATQTLHSDTDGDMFTSANALTSFDSDGFTLGSDGGVNRSASPSQSYVGWAWKAGTDYTSTITGFDTEDCSINAEAGFGIYKLGGTNTASTFTHGLGTTPDIVIAKGLTGGNNWFFWSRAVHDANTCLKLSSASGNITKSGIIPTVNSTTIGVDSYGETASGVDYIYYVFSGREGFSKFGSYQGSNTTGGPFIYLGFRPAFVMIKQTATNNGWFMFDSKRNPYNETNSFIMADMDNFTIETTDGNRGIDLLSNGFKLETGNQFDPNGSGTYLYMAFAEMPFKYSNAR